MSPLFTADTSCSYILRVKRRVGIAILVLFLSTLLLPSAVAASAGGTCSVLNKKVLVGTVTLLCKKNTKGVKVWTKVGVAKASPVDTPTPSPSPVTAPAVIDLRYLDRVTMPDGRKICPLQTGFQVAEVQLSGPASVFSQFGKREGATGETVCRASLSESVAREFPKLPMSSEAMKALASWTEFRQSRKPDTGVVLRFMIDPTGDERFSARDVVVFREAASVFAPELGAGANFTIAIGYSDDFILNAIDSNETFVDREGAFKVWNVQGRQQQCFGNFWQPKWEIGGQRPSTFGDITLCNHRMVKSPAPDGAHTASHEFTHAVQSALKNYEDTEFSMWWSEGGAFFYGSLVASDLGLLDVERNRAFWIYQLATETKARTLAELETDEGGSRRGGFLAVEYLASKYGVKTYFDIYRKQTSLRSVAREGRPVGNLAAAFKAVTGEEFDHFIKEANAYIVHQVENRLRK